jgi:hypothetical protein
MVLGISAIFPEKGNHIKICNGTKVIADTLLIADVKRVETLWERFKIGLLSFLNCFKCTREYAYQNVSNLTIKVINGEDVSEKYSLIFTDSLNDFLELANDKNKDIVEHIDVKDCWSISGRTIEIRLKAQQSVTQPKVKHPKDEVDP